jgi:hypothetical protein
MVCLHPLVLTLFGSGAHEAGCPNPVRARERVVGSKVETAQQNTKRQGDIGITGVLGTDSVVLIDLTISDGGGSKPGPGYQPGVHRQQNADAKRANYVGDNARFTGIQGKQLIVPSWDAMGGATEETEKFLQIVNQSIAAGSSESFAVIANRTRCRIAIALYNSIAFNALASRNLLLPAARRAAPGRPAGNSQRQAQGMGGAALLATAARVGQVRDALSQIVRAQGTAQEDSRAEQSSEGVDGGHSQSEQGLAEAGGSKRRRTVAGAGSGEAVAGSSQEATGSSALAQAASRSSRAASRSRSNTSTSLRASTVRDGSQQGDDNG